ncbi:unnamed protein product, partial [Rotaria sp. Silwood1]
MTDEFNRYYIKIRTILEIDAKTICEELTTVLEPDAPAYSPVAKWVKRFHEERADVNDEFRCGRPILVFTDENIEQVRQVIEDAPHSTYNDIIAETSFSRGTIERIIHDCLRGIARKPRPIQADPCSIELTDLADIFTL